MAPTRHDVGPQRSSKKVSHKRSELALDAMQAEVDVARKQERNTNVLQMMDKSTKIADRCYAISLAEQKKTETEFMLHRNFTKVRDVPVYRKEEPVRQSNCINKAVFERIASDKKMMEETFKYVTGFQGFFAL